LVTTIERFYGARKRGGKKGDLRKPECGRKKEGIEERGGFYGQKEMPVI